MSSELKSLPKETVRLIGSSQVITSVYSVVKELLENSFDAEATTVDIKLENYGFDKIEVRDNGSGIKKANIPLVALRYHTSKISSFADLESLSTFGFRGEALGSLCAVSSLSITSKSVSEDVSHTYSFDHHGKVVLDQPSHLGQGTTVLTSNLFSNMPVRRQYYKTVKKKKEELKRVEDLCLAYGVIRPHVRLTLRHNKEVVWQKIPSPDTRTALMGIIGRSIFSQLEYKTTCVDEFKMTFEAYLPKADSNVSVTSKSVNDRSFVAVNGRPVQVKEIEKIVRQHYCNQKSCDGRHPVYFISLSLPTSEVDVNLDPNKNRVMLQQQKLVLEAITDICAEVYGPIAKAVNKNVEKDNSNDTINDSVNTHESPDCSWLDNQKPANRNADAKVSNADIDNATVAKLTNKFGFSVDTEISSTDLVKGYNISFYNGQGSNCSDLETAANSNNLSEERKKTVAENELESVETTDNAGDNSEKANCEAEKIDFDILDADLNDLLRTQTDKTCENNKTSHASFGVDDCFDDTGEFTKIVTNLNLDKENFESVLDSKITNSLNDNVKDCNSLEKTVDTQWSKGTLKNQAGDQVLQPVQLLVQGNQVARNKRPPSPTHDLELLATTPPAKKKPPSIQIDQPRIYDMVSNSSSDKFSAGFVAFSKQMRPKVVEDNADASFDEITAKVRSMWDKLTDSEREEFCQAGALQVQELRKTVTASKRQLIQKLDRRIAPVKGLPSIKDQLLAGAPQKGGLKKPVPIKSVKVAFSLSKLKGAYTHPPQSQTQAHSNMRLVGPLKYYNGWVCCHGNKLKLINPHRVEETLLHRELMEEHAIGPTRLDSPQPISESCVGGPRLYQALLDMVPPDSHQTYVHIEDKRLTANGIQVRCHLDQDGQSILELVGLSSAMPMYGLKDLQEILDLIVNTGATTVNKARPLKVVFYLQGEAVRMIRQRPVHRSWEDMLDLLQQMEDTLLPVDCVQCLHNKPFLHTVYDMEDTPVTQSGTGSSLVQ